VIRNSSIKRGAIGYQIIGDTVTQIGTSSADGELTLSITQDPIIAIANAPVQNNNNGGGGGPVFTIPEPTVNKPIEAEKPVEVAKPVVDIPQKRITSFTKTTKVYFGLDASCINSKNIKNIRTFFAGISKIGNIKEITIQGFTQPTRINPDPLGLSVARAKAVGKFVKSQGLVSKIITQGKGNAKANNANSRYVLVTVTGELSGN
jgi:outer membrane protein OmpA-like peptidoglycan-associated protein